MSKLVLLNGAAAGKVFELSEASHTLGRDSHNGIYVPDGRASRQHAEISCERGLYVIRDLGSSNGTWINGQRINDPQVLASGDRIGIGRSVLSFECDEPRRENVTEGTETTTHKEDIDKVESISTGDDLTLLAWKKEEIEKGGIDDPLVRLKTIYHYADRMRRSWDIKSLSQVLLDAIFEILRPDRAGILLPKAPGSREFVSYTVRTSKAPSKNEKEEITIPQTILNRLLEERAMIVVPDTSKDRETSEAVSILAQHIGTVVACPLVSGEDIYGILYMDMYKSCDEINRSVLELFSGIASQAALAVGNCLNHMSELKNRDVKMQLDVAHKIHDRLLPNEPYETEKLWIGGINRPSSRVGGDYFDVFNTERGELVTISDSTGHGIGAALIMTTARAYLKALVNKSDPTMEEIVRGLNALLSTDLDPGLFVTQAFLRLEEGGEKLSYLIAGHEPPFLFRRSERRFINLETGGLAIGIQPDFRYKRADPIHLTSGDRIYLFTDGILEQEDREGEQFGHNRLKEAIMNASDADPQGSLHLIIKAVDEWRAGVDQGDDYTISLIEIK